jgi:hypothetical protein
VPINFAWVFNTNGSLTAIATVGVNPVQVPINLSVSHGSDLSSPILDLSLQPIHLNLLGLNLQTSPICLDITTHQGGGLLGNLLYNLGGALTSDSSPAMVLGALSPLQSLLLSFGLTQALNGAAAALSTSATTNTSPSVPPGATDILDLTVGPLDLNVLGLQAHLDNCANGPVIVDLFAQPGGGFLGQLLAGLGGLTSGLGTAQQQQLLTAIADNILMAV